MARFNFVDAAAKGYMFAWNERRALAQLAFAPLLVKIASFTVIIAAGLEENLLRQGLALLPAYFLEGWLVACAIRLALFGERWPRGTTARSRAIMAGTVSYLLIKLIASVFVGLLMTSGNGLISEPAPAPTLAGFMAMIAFLALALWAFRLFWLYAPLAMGYPALAFLKKIESYATSFYMLGLWLLVMAPMALVTLAIASGLQALFPGAAPDNPSGAFMYFFAAAQAFIETLIAVIASVGMAHGFREIISGDNMKNTLF